MRGGLLTGIYRHYSGLLVQVLGMAEHTETKEKLVVYICLSTKAGYKTRARPYEMFLEKIKHNGKTVPRFKYLGPEISIKEQNQPRDSLGQSAKKIE